VKVPGVTLLNCLSREGRTSDYRGTNPGDESCKFFVFGDELEGGGAFDSPLATGRLPRRRLSAGKGGSLCQDRPGPHRRAKSTV